MTEGSVRPATALQLALQEDEVEQRVRETYRRQRQALFGLALRLRLDEEDAADAVQETMLRLWQELASGGPVADCEAWSFRVLYRIAMDRHRLERRLQGLGRRLTSLAGSRAEPSGDPAERVDVDAVWHAVDRLPERQRAVLYLRYRADLPYERIGLALGISAGAARGEASTAIAALRRRLAPTMSEEAS